VLSSDLSLSEVEGSAVGVKAVGRRTVEDCCGAGRRCACERIVASASCVVSKTFYNVLSKEWLINYPFLTAKMLSRNQPHSQPLH
jgi:hypothetical protein